MLVVEHLPVSDDARINVMEQGEVSMRRGLTWRVRFGYDFASAKRGERFTQTYSDTQVVVGGGQVAGVCSRTTLVGCVLAGCVVDCAGCRALACE